MEIPKDIVDALNGCPLTFLVPREDVVHLLSARDVQLVPSVMFNEDPSHKLNGIRSSLNNDLDGEFEQLTLKLLDDFEQVDLSCLKALKFRKPAIKYNKQRDQIELPLGSLDRSILDKFEDIERLDIVKPLLKMKRIKLGQRQIAEQARSVEKKRNLDEDEEEEEEDLVFKKSRKTTYLKTDELTEKAGLDFITFMDQLGFTQGGFDSSQDFLSVQSLNKIHNWLLRLQGSDFLLHGIQIDYLIGLQELCAKSLRKFAGSNWDDITRLDDADQIIEFNNVAMNAATASMVMMQLFSSKRTEKVLYLESYLYAVLDFIYSILEITIIPLSKLVITDAKISWRNNFIALQQLINQILVQLNKFLKSNNLDEGFITRLEYLSSMVLFAEINLKDKTSILGLAAFESLRISCCDIICTIFHKKDDQRQFILDEILSNLDKLPTNRTQARQFKLHRGINVQLISFLLLRFLHTFDLTDFQFENDNFSILMNTNWDELGKKEQEELMLIQNNFTSFALERTIEMVQIANQISSAMLNKFFKNIDTNSKHIFEILLEDLLNIVALPECAGAETLLVSLLKTLMYIFENESYSAPSQTFALEMIGSIGCKILQLKNQKECIDLTYNMSVLDFTSLARDYTNCLVYLQQQNLSDHHTNQIANNSFQFMLLKLVQSINELVFQSKPPNDATPSTLFLLCSKFQRQLIFASREDYIKVDSGMAANSNLESQSMSSYNTVLLSQELLHLYDNFLNLVVKSLDHNKIKSRTRAIKNLSSLMSREPSLLTLRSVSTSIILRMNDNSLQVRDAVIELIGQFLGSRPQVIDDYYQILCQKMDDPSIAVRKRVVKLSKEIYNLTTKRNVKSLIAEKLLRRLEDEEDNIIDLARVTLLEFWFLSLADEAADNYDTTLRPMAMAKIDVILDVVDKSEKNWDYFTMFLTDHVLIANEDDPPELHSKIMKALKIIIDKTLDFVIECVDSKELKKKVEKAMGLLSVITKADGKLISQDQLICLKPYLTDESSTGDTVCYYTLSIFRHALPEATILKPSFIKDSQISLLKRLTKFNVKELVEAMPCAYILSSMRNDVLRMATAAISCLKLAKPFLERANQGQLDEFDPKLLRLLFLIGNFGKYCDFNNHRQLFLKASCGLGENEQTVSIFVKFLLCFANETLNHQIKRAAIKNLIYVCSSHPKLLMTEPLLNIMDRELNGDETDIKSLIIQEFIEFLEHEEALNLKTTSKNNTKNKQLDIAVLHGNSLSFATDGICASLVQRYMEPILLLTLYENGGFSILATKYLQLVVKLGFSNPKLCIPSIVALESSPIFALRSRALSMHKDLFEKHESLIETSYVEGVRLAFMYRKRLSNNYMHENNFIKNFYQVIGDSRTTKKKFLISLMKSFVINFKDNDVSRLKLHKEYVIFVFNNLKTAGIAILEEAYIVCNAIDKFVSSEGVELSLKIASLLNNGSLSDPNEWLYWCCCSQLFIALLRFREYLFHTYNLSEDKATDFQHNKVDKELRVAPRTVKDVLWKWSDLLSTSKEDCQLVCLRFVKLIEDDDSRVSIYE